MKTQQKRLRKSENWEGLYWCPCGHGPIGNTSLCYETKHNDRSVRSNPVITRAYYRCSMCEAEFDLTETHKGHWEYKTEV